MADSWVSMETGRFWKSFLLEGKGSIGCFLSSGHLQHAWFIKHLSVDSLQTGGHFVPFLTPMLPSDPPSELSGTPVPSVSSCPTHTVRLSHRRQESQNAVMCLVHPLISGPQIVSYSKRKLNTFLATTTTKKIVWRVGGNDTQVPRWPSFLELRNRNA